MVYLYMYVDLTMPNIIPHLYTQQFMLVVYLTIRSVGNVIILLSIKKGYLAVMTVH